MPPRYTRILPFISLLLAPGLWGAAAPAEGRSFSACLSELEARARTENLSPRVLALVPTMVQQQRVLELDSRQPEFTRTFGQYLESRLTAQRIARGRDMYRRHRPFLNQLTAKYGVPGQYLVAFWGLETNYGGYLGNMPTLDSLATLACDPRRGDYFATEFVNALRVMERESLGPDAMRGSWAGAVGHTQFMPSNYLRYGVDGDGNGRIDLWQSDRDALASAAYFLSELGWQDSLRWGREVKLPAGFDYGLAGRDGARSLSQWRQLGVRRTNGTLLPAMSLNARLIVPAGHRGPAFLVYDNFDIIMKWNRSESYALSVGLLADLVAGGSGLWRQPPADQQALSRQQIEKLQLALNQQGYEVGEADGVMGPSTRSALRQYQRDQGLISDGYPDRQILERLVPGGKN